MKSRTFFILVFIFLVSLGCFSCKTTATDDFSIFRHKGNSARRICKGTFHSPGKKYRTSEASTGDFLPFALDKYTVLRWKVFRKKEKNVVLW